MKGQPGWLKTAAAIGGILETLTGKQLPSVKPPPGRAEQAGREPPDGAFSASLRPPPQSSAFEQERETERPGSKP